MDYRDFEWMGLEGELAANKESPLETLIRREDMRQLADSLIKLNQAELACVMMMNYGEVERTVVDVQKDMSDWRGNPYSKYKIRGFEESGLRKVRLRLKIVFGWER
jgi:hypothetical protein